MRKLAALCCILGGLAAHAQDHPDATAKTILSAMHDEMRRSQALRVANLDPPYFIEYSLEDADAFGVSATLGGLLSESHHPLRALEVKVRVGSFDFDNCNYVLSGYRAGGSGEESPLPLDNDYRALRQTLWLATDNAFKTAEEAISRKRSALKNVNMPDALPDFSKAPVAESIAPSSREPIDEAALKALTVKLSRIFLSYPKIFASTVNFESIQADSYLATSEGTVIRQPEGLAYFRVRAAAQAPDGMELRNAEVFNALRVSDLPDETALTEGVTRLAADLTALAGAPMAEDYDGPVLFEPLAAAQLFGQVFGDALKVTRKPVPQSGRPAPYLPSEFEGRIGARVLPEWINIVDDPTQTTWRGHPLFGTYSYDDEGVKAGPLPLVDHGVLKNFLLTRTPVYKGFETSNGRARLHGSYGAAAPDFSNLFVEATKTIPEADLKKQLIELCKQRNKPYGILIRKLDFPSSASIGELRRMFATAAQSGSGTRPVCPPLLAYRVYPDGREELVRGLRFRDLSTRSFKDILAASEESAVFSFLDNTFPLALMGAGSYVSPATVVAPGVLFDEITLEKSNDELPKPPIVPPPGLKAGD